MSDKLTAIRSRREARRQMRRAFRRVDPASFVAAMRRRSPRLTPLLQVWLGLCLLRLIHKRQAQLDAEIDRLFEL